MDWLIISLTVALAAGYLFMRTRRALREGTCCGCKGCKSATCPTNSNPKTEPPANGAQ